MNSTGTSKNILIVCLLLRVFCFTLVAAEVQGIKFDAGFVPESREILLGEPLYITFYVTNTGTQTFYLETGGDSRGVRSQRFQFSATDEMGNIASDPHPNAEHFGGILGPPPEISPGKPYLERLYLPLWVRFDRPGKYAMHGERLLQLLNKQEFSRDYTLVQPLKADFQIVVLPKNAELLGKRIQQLGRMLESGDAASAARQLADIDDDRVVPYLVFAIEHDKRDALALAAVGLGKHPGPEAVTALTKALKDKKDSYVRSSAASAMGNMKSTAAMDALVAALGDDNDSVRCAVVGSLGRNGNRNAVEVLKTRLVDSSMAVRSSSVEALLALGESFNTEWVKPIIKSKDPVFQNVVWLVRQNAGSNAPAILIDCVDFSNASVTNYYNYTLAWQIHACGGPQLTYHHDFDKEGTPEQIEENRRTLKALQNWSNSVNSSTSK
jgi:hypothetical protein